MDDNARELAAVYRKAAGSGVLEKDFRGPVEQHLLALAKKLGIELVARTEHTLGTSGRADTIYNRFIIEWKAPGTLKPSNNATPNRQVIAQVQHYGDSLFWVTREKPGRIVGCCTDGRYFIFVTKPERTWIASDPIPVDAQSCSRFLDYFLALRSGVALLPEYLSDDFSSENERTQRTVKALYTTLLEHAAAPSLDAIFSQWAQFYGAVTEYEQWRVKLANEEALRKMVRAFGIPAEKLDLNRFFFATHTYFALLTKLLAYIIVGRYTDLPSPPLTHWKDASNADLARHFSDLEKGGPFHAAGIRNFLEGDFFAWYTKYFTPEIADCLRMILTRLSMYDPATLDLAPAPTQDLLKKLYHRLVSPHIRKALGEYYTPDWLAQRLLNMLDGGTFRGEPDVRLLDPACGSGTFLVMTINAIRKNSIAQSIGEGRLLRKICSNVVGIDLNPLAVIAARTNYLLALGPLLKHRGKESLEIPVYLADSIMTPSRNEQDLFEQDKVRVVLSFDSVVLPRRLATQHGIAVLTEELERHLDKTPSTPPQIFSALTKEKLTACGADWDRDGKMVETLYSKLYDLHAAGRNGLWARIIKNAFAPVFLAPFDYVAGNPPWINWQNLPEGYRNETKELWFRQGLFVHKGMDTILGKGKKDISMLMTYVAADSYLKDGGKLGFVITQSVFKTSGAGQGFRQFEIKKGRDKNKPLSVIFVDDFSELQLFEGATNRTAVFIMRKGQPTKYPVQYSYWRKKEGGRKGSFDYDSTIEEVLVKTQRLQFIAEPVNDKDMTSAWLTGRRKALIAIKKILGKSDYEAHEGVNTGGANAVYWFELLKEHGDGTVTARNITEGAKRKIESVHVRIEKDLLYPLLRGRDIHRWGAKPSAHILFVQDVKTRRGIDENVMKDSFPMAYEWLVRNKSTLLKRSSQSIKNLMKKHAFYSMFGVGDYTMAPWKVVWSEVANELDAAAVFGEKEKPLLVDHTGVEIAMTCRKEAEYVAGLMNSTIFRYAVARYIVLHPDPHILENLRIPKFNSQDHEHIEIAEEAKRLSKSDGGQNVLIHHELDNMCAKFWGVDGSNLKAIQDAYTELYAPRNEDGSLVVKEESATYGEEEPIQDDA